MNKAEQTEIQAALVALPSGTDDRDMVKAAMVDVASIFDLNAKDVAGVAAECLTALGMATRGAKTLVAKKKSVNELVEIQFAPGTTPALVVLASMANDARRLQKTVCGKGRLPFHADTVKAESLKRNPPAIEA